MISNPHNMIRGSNNKTLSTLSKYEHHRVHRVHMYVLYIYKVHTDDRRSSRYRRDTVVRYTTKFKIPTTPSTSGNPFVNPPKSCCWVACACVISITTCIPPTPCLSAKNRPHRLQPRGIRPHPLLSGRPLRVTSDRHERTRPELEFANYLS